MFDLSKIHNFFYSSKQKTFSTLADLISYFYIKVYLFFILSINILIWLVAFYIDSKIQEEQIALHYNVDFGIDFYGSKAHVYIIPVLGFLILVLNLSLLLGVIQHKDRRFISHLLLATALMTNIILLVSVISVYLINFV